MTNEQKRRRFKFEGATPESLAKALLRPVQVPKDTARRGVSVQLGEDEIAPHVEDEGPTPETSPDQTGDIERDGYDARDNSEADPQDRGLSVG